MTEKLKQQIDKLEKLKKGWDANAQEGFPIKPEIIEGLRDNNILTHLLEKFQALGISEDHVDIVPISSGNVQIEAEHGDVYLEIELDEKIKEKWQ